MRLNPGIAFGLGILAGFALAVMLYGVLIVLPQV